MTVLTTLEHHREELQRLARDHGVQRLEAFGSVARGSEAPESDVDLLVEFEAASPTLYARRYFAFSEALEQLLGRSVELIEIKELDNPYFIRHIAADRTPLYAR